MTDSPLADAFIQAGYYSSGDNGPVTRIVVHGTVSPCEVGGARSVANYFAAPGAGGSAHYVVDPSEVVQCVAESQIAYHAPPNLASLGVEFCDPQQGDPARWQDGPHQQMLALGARLVADLCARHSIPVTHIDAGGLLNGQWGVPGHVDVSQAWRQSDHTDPGPDFPWGQFLAMVAGPAAPPKPQPVQPPAPVQEDDMIIVFKAPDGKSALASIPGLAGPVPPEPILHLPHETVPANPDLWASLVDQFWASRGFAKK